MAWPLRGGGFKGLATKKNNFFEALFKLFNKKGPFATKLERGEDG